MDRNSFDKPASDVAYQADQNLTPDDWTHALLGNEHDNTRPPFKIVEQEIDDGLEHETLSIREGALLEWWKIISHTDISS